MNKVIMLLSVATFYSFSNVAVAAANDIGYRTYSANVMLGSIDQEKQKNLIYINALSIKNEDDLSFFKLRNNVLENGARYLIDFSDGYDETQKKAAKEKIKNVIGVSFSGDWLVVGMYKGDLIYTPFDSVNDSLLNIALSRKGGEEGVKSKSFLKSDDKLTLPHIAFYLEVNRPITDAECTFDVSPIWDRGSKSFCSKANIALVYRVNLMRSLAFGVTGSSTPDVKLVRISLDSESSGAGIQLNEALVQKTEDVGYNLLDGWYKSYTTSAIAKDYKFSIGASNSTASILKTFPVSNLNNSYENRDTSGFEIGVTGSAGVGPDGPKTQIDAKYSYNQSRTLVYKTEDYRVARSANNAQNVTFTWERDQYPTASSLLYKTTATIWGGADPIDLKRIKPISYQGFVPNFDVVYKANPEATGTTRFTVASSVNLFPIYSAAYKHYYVFGGHLSFQSKDSWVKNRRFNADTFFDVDWGHAVFSGGRPVNLQLAGFNNKCVSFGGQSKIEIATCDLTSSKQSFIYDSYGRYSSAMNMHKCLDAKNSKSFNTCDSSLSQRWKWDESSDNVKDVFSGKYLAHDIASSNIVYSDSKDSVGNINVNTITKYTDIFSK